MKHISKICIIIAFFTFGTALTLPAWAQQSNLNDWIDNLNDNIPFGYAPGQKISVSAIDNQKVTISSPMIMDDLGGKLKKYTVMYSEYTLDQMLGQTALLTQAKEKTFNFTGTETTLSMDLGLYDGIDPLKTYYVLVMPKDDQGVGGQISNEIWFKLGGGIYGEGVYTWTNDPIMHAAAGADMSLAGTTHQCNPDCLSKASGSKKITLKWIAVPGSSQVDISLKIDGVDADFNRLGTVNMVDERYEMTTNKNGVHVFNLKANNWGTEVRYTVNIDGINVAGTTPWTGIVKVPKTWPRENVIVAILLSLWLYIWYRKLHR